jgi:hypothetical protein
MIIEGFMPSNNASVIIAVTNVVQSVRLPTGVTSGGANFRQGGGNLRIAHMGAAASPNVFFETSNAGDLKVASTTTSPVLQAGQVGIFRRAPNDDFISIIGDAAGPVNVCVTVGN